MGESAITTVEANPLTGGLPSQAAPSVRVELFTIDPSSLASSIAQPIFCASDLPSLPLIML